MLVSQSLAEQFKAGEIYSNDPTSGDGAAKAQRHAQRAHDYSIVLRVLDAILNEADETFPLETVSLTV